jgi:hypothetical protein
VAITGKTTLLPNEIATYTLTIDQLNAGDALSIEISNGMLMVADPSTRLLNSRIMHAATNTGDWIYNFDLMAPSSIGATALLSATEMAFNGNGGSDSGDIWSNLGSPLSITVIAEPGTGLLMGMGLGILGIAGRRRKLS